MEDEKIRETLDELSNLEYRSSYDAHKMVRSLADAGVFDNDLRVASQEFFVAVERLKMVALQKLSKLNAQKGT